VVDCVYSFLHNGGARFIPSPEGEGSSLPLHPDIINMSEIRAGDENSRGFEKGGPSLFHMGEMEI
jgi:hypothetical protein